MNVFALNLQYTFSLNFKLKEMRQGKTQETLA